MKTLLTGAAGFIGSHLAERLLEEGHEVTGLDNFDSFLYPAAIKEKNVAGLACHPRFELARGDLLDGKLVSALCQGKDLVVHLAALAGVRPSLLDPPRYARVNVEGTVNVLEGCRLAGASRLVFASSSSVYGARGGVSSDKQEGRPPVAAFCEDDPCLSPASPYAATKRAGELLCSNYRDLFAIGISSLRFFTVYGPRQRPEMAIHKFTRQIHQHQAITLFGDGGSARDYTYIDDIVDGAYAACLRVTPGDYRIYNLGGSRTTTLRRLVELIGDALGIEPIVEHAPAQPGDVPITYANVSRAATDLGYSPSVPIEEGIRRFVAWYRAEPRG
ncbi:MAG: NAD-dependent epimerase/dehydratase family protein [Pseudomonadota bacterium]